MAGRLVFLLLVLHFFQVFAGNFSEPHLFRFKAAIWPFGQLATVVLVPISDMAGFSRRQNEPVSSVFYCKFLEDVLPN
jgi:hypothetical protein